MMVQSCRTALFSAVTTSPRATTSAVMMADPLLPSFSSTFRLGCLAISFFLTSSATASKSSLPSSSTIELSKRSSSVSFGEMQVMLSSSSSGIVSSLPPQSRITVFPWLNAYLAAERLTPVGTSFCRSKYCDWSITFLKSSCSSQLANYILVPPQMTIELSPSSLTVMQAMPVCLPASTLHCRSTPAPTISVYRCCFASSLPTCPKKQLLPASFPTATAWLAPFPPLAVKQRCDWMVQPTAGIFLTQRKWSALALPNTQIFL